MNANQQLRQLHEKMLKDSQQNNTGLQSPDGTRVLRRTLTLAGGATFSTQDSEHHGYSLHDKTITPRLTSSLQQ